MKSSNFSPDEQTNWRIILNRYSSPDLRYSLWQITNTLLPFFILCYLMYRSLEVSYWLTLLLAIPTAGLFMRSFIIFHDCGHGSFFKSQTANDVVGIITGILAFTPYYQWKHDHAIHHATAGNLDRRGVGDVQTLTVREYRELPRWKRFSYRIMRNPVIMFTVGAFLVFTVGHRFSRKWSGPRERRNVVWTNLALAAIIVGLCLIIGWKEYLLVQVPILFIATSAGVWLFYVQHNFDGAYWEHQDKWDFIKAGLNGSSFYDLPAILRWFSGNIGYHHIHHLSPRIPNYNLQKCHEENEIFHVKPLTIAGSLKSLRIRFWDEESRQMVGYEALKRSSKRMPDLVT
jgi:omega-6 fatty acid desaturase (delta-12 desaturase)